MYIIEINIAHNETMSWRAIIRRLLFYISGIVNIIIKCQDNAIAFVPFNIRDADFSNLSL